MYLILLSFLFSFSIMASSKISPKAFLKMVDRNKVSFERDTSVLNDIALNKLMFINGNRDKTIYPQELVNKIKAVIASDLALQYSNYDKKYMDVAYVIDQPYRYQITFDFGTSRNCVLRIHTLNMNCGMPFCSKKDPKKSSNVDFYGTKIDMKYCEKIYNNGKKIKIK